MNSNTLSNLILFTTCLCPGILLIGGVLLVDHFAENGRPLHKSIWIPVSLVFAFATIFFFLVVYDSSGFLRFIFTGSVVIVSVLAVILAVAQGVWRKNDFGRKTLMQYFLNLFLILISSGAGLFISNTIIGGCESFHLRSGDNIVQALESYYRDNQQYPDTLSALVPAYIRQDTAKTCYSLRVMQQDLSTSQINNFYYKKCPSGTTQLSIPEMGSGHFHIYDLNDKKWYISTGDTLEEWDRVTRCQDYQ